VPGAEAVEAKVDEPEPVEAAPVELSEEEVRIRVKNLTLILQTPDSL